MENYTISEAEYMVECMHKYYCENLTFEVSNTAEGGMIVNGTTLDRKTVKVEMRSEVFASGKSRSDLEVGAKVKCVNILISNLKIRGI